MISVSLSLQPRAAEAVLTPGVECVALKELRALRARILPSNRLLDALDLSRIIERSDALLSNSSNKFLPRISSETAPLPLMTPNGLYSSTVPT